MAKLSLKSLTFLTIISLLFQLLGLWSFITPVKAQGELECELMEENVDPGPVEFTSPGCTRIWRVGIKAVNWPSGGYFEEDTTGCYTITGIGTQTATVKRIEGPDCQEKTHAITHIEFCFEEGCCGDSKVDLLYEECDMGAQNGIQCEPEYGKTCNYCSSLCDKWIEVPVQEWCGDGILQGSYEECDGGSRACETLEGYAGAQECLEDCSGWTECLTKESCGDGILNGEEDCDGEDGVLEHYICTNECKLEYVSYCGDGNIDENEECDDGNNLSGDRCSSTCQLEYCGDGIINNINEKCDGTAGVFEHYRCTEECSLEYIPYCGDEIKNGDEKCDGTDGVPTTGGYSCTSQCTLAQVKGEEAEKKPGKVLGAETGSSLKLSLGVASVSSLLASIGLYLLSKVTNGKDWRKKKRRK